MSLNTCKNCYQRITAGVLCVSCLTAHHVVEKGVENCSPVSFWCVPPIPDEEGRHHNPPRTLQFNQVVAVSTSASVTSSGPVVWPGGS